MADIIKQNSAPKFNGDNPQPWLQKIPTFFDIQKIPEDQRLEKAEFALEGGALEWYRWMKSNKFLHNWHDLLVKIEVCFGQSHEFVHHRDELSKLTQKGNVAEYQAEYERVMNSIVTGVSEPQLITLFIEGLKSNLKEDVKAAKPKTVLKAFLLAQHYEAQYEKGNFLRGLVGSSTWNAGPNVSGSATWNVGPNVSGTTHQPNLKFPYEETSWGSQSQTMPQWVDPSKFVWVLPNFTNRAVNIAPNDSFGLLPTPSQQPNPSRRKRKLSAAELQERRKKGLYYNCDKVFTPKHKCEPPLP